jgi:hypothetical protein
VGKQSTSSQQENWFGDLMNQLVTISSPTLPALVTAARRDEVSLDEVERIVI